MKHPCRILGHFWESALVSVDNMQILQICRRCRKSRTIKTDTGKEVQKIGEGA